MAFRFVDDNANKTCTTFLYDDINIYNYDVTDLAIKLLQLERDGYTTFIMRINCNGGSVMTGSAIYNLLKQTKSLTKIAKIDFMSASMATGIMCAFDRVEIAKNAKVMIHNAQGICIGDYRDFQRDLNFLLDLQKDFVAHYKNKTKKLTEQRIQQMMDAETFLNAEQALQQGFVDGIYDDEIQVSEAVNSNDKKIVDLYIKDISSRLAAKFEVAPAAPTSTPTQSNNTNMDGKLLRQQLGMPETATDAEVTAKLAALQTEAAAAKTQVANANKAELERLLTEKQITGAARDGFLALGVGDFENTKKAIEAIPAAVKPTDFIDPTAASNTPAATGAATNTPAAGAKGITTWAQFTKLPSDQQEKFEKENRDAYCALYAAEFGEQPS